MKRFLDSQIKPKEEREREREERKLEREQERREKAALKNPHGYPEEPPHAGFSRFGTGQSGLASAADLDEGHHGRHHFGRVANPAPLGLFAFGFSTFLLGLVNIGTEGVRETTSLVGPFLLYTGIMMGVSAIFELIAGNTFGATAFGTLSGFFLSFGAILYPAFGTFDTFTTNPLLIFKFLGLFFATWCIPFGIFIFVSVRSTWTLWLQFLFIEIALVLSCAQYLSQNSRPIRIAAGAILIIVSILAYVNGAAGLMAKETTFIAPPNLALPWAARPKHAQRHEVGHQGHHGHHGQHANHEHDLERPQPINHSAHPSIHQGSIHETYGTPRGGMAPPLVGTDAPYRA